MVSPIRGSGAVAGVSSGWSWAAVTAISTARRKQISRRSYGRQCGGRPLLDLRGMPLHRLDAVTHDLAPHYAALRAIRTRKKLMVSEVWARLGNEITRVLGAVERGDHSDARGPHVPGRM